MVELWIIIAMLCLLTVTGGALLALRRISRSLDNSRQEREAWQQAQEGRQRTWEVRQGKHILDAEKKLADQLKDARREWRDWNAQIQQDHQEWRADVDLEKELARLPRIEQLELAHQTANGRLQPRDWRPPLFYKADLRGRDLSHRYMERADLREVQLMEANLYMSDLAGASMAGADLQQANLMGVNLAGADLRGANLSGANFIVADLHNAVLHGANLTGARNLTPAQLQSAIYDSTTIIDSAIDITLPRIPSVSTTPSKLLAAPSATSQQNIGETDTPSELDVNTSSSEQPKESATFTPPDATSLANTDEHANAVPPADISTDAPPTSRIDETSVLAIEQSPDTSVLAEANPETLPENSTSATTTSKKQNAARKRSSKVKQAAAPTQTTASKPEEANTNTANASRKSTATEEMGEFEEEEMLPYKIIQWPTRARKTNPLPNPGEQNKGDKPQKNRGNNPATNFNDASDDGKNQHAQAN